MKFNTPEAQKIFRLAIFVEKQATNANKKFIKKEITDENYIKLKAFLGEFAEKSSSIVNNKCKEFIGSKGIKNG